jgi:ABC-2 type transport system ATP-binding protein
MSVVDVSCVAKAFGETQAVDDVSFSVEGGELFGLLGPNGAGKTTTIRLVLDLLKPDRGSVSVLGGPMTETKKDRIGYMPEERGLYGELSLERCLVYLATLKGMSKAAATERLGVYLDRFDLTAHRRRKVKELSKGMQQKAQIIATVLHGPELLIVDEPFAGLDPVNTQLVKDLLRELRASGATVIMSTHQMHQVEELCDRILLINHGRNVLYGPLDEIRRRFAGDAVMVHTAGPLPPIPGVVQVTPQNGDSRLVLAANTRPQAILEALVAQRVVVDKFEVAVPSLDEIFIQAVTGA